MFSMLNFTLNPLVASIFSRNQVIAPQFDSSQFFFSLQESVLYGTVDVPQRYRTGPVKNMARKKKMTSLSVFQGGNLKTRKMRTSHSTYTQEFVKSSVLKKYENIWDTSVRRFLRKRMGQREYYLVQGPIYILTYVYDNAKLLPPYYQLTHQFAKGQESPRVERLEDILIPIREFFSELFKMVQTRSFLLIPNQFPSLSQPLANP